MSKLHIQEMEILLKFFAGNSKGQEGKVIEVLDC